MLIADSEEELQNILIRVTVESENKGLQLNAKKTECMVISNESNIPVCNILCKGEIMKQVNTFKSLGFTMTPDARCDTEIKTRLDTFTKMKSIFTNRNIKVYSKSQQSESLHMSILLYGCECWTLTKERRLKAAEMWYIRRIIRISWTEKKSNEEVMEMAGYKRSLFKAIRKRQQQLLGI